MTILPEILSDASDYDNIGVVVRCSEEQWSVSGDHVSSETCHVSYLVQLCSQWSDSCSFIDRNMQAGIKHPDFGKILISLKMFEY